MPRLRCPLPGDGEEERPGQVGGFARVSGAGQAEAGIDVVILAIEPAERQRDVRRQRKIDTRIPEVALAVGKFDARSPTDDIVWAERTNPVKTLPGGPVLITAAAGYQVPTSAVATRVAEPGLPVRRPAEEVLPAPPEASGS